MFCDRGVMTTDTLTVVKRPSVDNGSLEFRKFYEDTGGSLYRY